MNEKYPSPYRHITHAQQFTPAFLFKLFALTQKMKKDPASYSGELSGKVVATLFYEPSTRTRLSFESAVHRLGGNVITTENAAEFSSASKGESIEDSVRIVSSYCDFLILRHNEDNSSKRALTTSHVPLINAGSGKSQHPTQALLDVYTIYEAFGHLDNLHVAVVGDLLHGRTCDSLVYLLSKFPETTFSFVSPPNCRVKKSLREHLTETGHSFAEYGSIQEILSSVDILYITRVQKERFSDNAQYLKAKSSYVITKKLIAHMKKTAIIMHPLPRVDEIATEVDDDPRARYFEQAKNGLYVRMAILRTLSDHQK